MSHRAHHDHNDDMAPPLGESGAAIPRRVVDEMIAEAVTKERVACANAAYAAASNAAFPMAAGEGWCMCMSAAAAARNAILDRKP